MNKQNTLTTQVTTSKNVLLLSHTLVIGGSERVLVNLTNLLRAMDYNVHILTLRTNIEFELPEDIILHDAKVPNWLRSKYLYEKWYAHAIHRLDKTHHFKCIFSNFLTVRSWLNRELEAKTFYYLHFDYTIPYKNLLAKAQKKAVKLRHKVYKYYNNRNVISVSQGAATSLTELFRVKPQKLHILYNFFDFNHIREKASEYLPPIKQPYILHVARFDLAQKRQDILLEAFAQLTCDIDLVMITQPNQQLSEMVAKHPKGHKIHIIPFHQNPYPWFKQAEVFVLSSDFEAMPMVIPESLICGTPVISTNCPSGPSEILINEMTQWLVPCKNAHELAKKIDCFLKEGNYNICNQALNQFSADCAVQKLQEIILTCK